MAPFDVRTLLIAVVLVSVLCAVARFMLARMHPAMPGLLRWAWASVLGAVAVGLLSLHGHVPEILSLSLAQVLIAVGFLLVWDAVRRFLGLQPLSLQTFVVLVLIVVIPVGVAHLSQSITVRTASNSAFIAALSAAIARDLLRCATPARVAMRTTGLLYGINAVYFSLRVVTASFHNLDVVPETSAGFTAFTLFWWLSVTIAVTLGMALMAGERLQEELDHQIRRDPLTGALNRRAFGQIADVEVARARRFNHPLSVLMMDLDHFKQINDRLGHSVGDDHLRRFVERVTHQLRTEDVLCRFGGEEFVVLLPETAAPQALAVADRLRIELAAAARLPSLSLPATVSIGIAQLEPAESLEEVLKRADVALYRAKNGGRNRCVVAAAAAPAVDVPNIPESC